MKVIKFDGTVKSAKAICKASKASPEMKKILMDDPLMGYVYSGGDDEPAKDFLIECPEGTQECKAGDLVALEGGEHIVYRRVDV